MFASWLACSPGTPPRGTLLERYGGLPPNPGKAFTGFGPATRLLGGNTYHGPRFHGRRHLKEAGHQRPQVLQAVGPRRKDDDGNVAID